MISRRRFYWMLVFLGLALVVAVTATIGAIQHDLLARGQAAIAAAGIPYYNLSIDGRDAVLRGFVTEGTDVARLAAIVAQVPGVRTVRNELTIERIVDPNTGAGGIVAATLPPELRAQHLGGLLVVAGRLPEGASDAFERALQQQFPGDELRVNVHRDSAVGSRDWTVVLGHVMSALAELDEPARLTAYGDVVQLSGQISSSSRRAKLEGILAGAPAVDWRLMLTQPSGNLGGAP